MLLLQNCTFLICRYSGFRRRTFITKQGVPRLRYALTTTLFAGFCAMSFLSAYMDKQSSSQDHLVLATQSSSGLTADLPFLPVFQRTFSIADMHDNDAALHIALEPNKITQQIIAYFNTVDTSPVKHLWQSITKQPAQDSQDNLKLANTQIRTTTGTDKHIDQQIAQTEHTTNDNSLPRNRTLQDALVAALLLGKNIDSTPVHLVQEESNVKIHTTSEINTASIDGIANESTSTINRNAKTLTVKTGDTLAGILQRGSIDDAQIYKIVQAVNKVYDPRQIRPGQKVSIQTMPMSTHDSSYAIEMPLNKLETLMVSWNDHSDTVAQIEKQALHKELRAKRIHVKNFLYQAAMDAGVPKSVISKAVQLYSWNIDFQRDIHRGDEIELLYEVQVTDEGEVVQAGDLLYASIETLGKKMPVYRYELSDGHTAYFEPGGTSMRKALMQTPVDGAYISSGYGMRKHPILGYSKMHKGVDFAAPRGTPIYAAGNGTIEKLGRWGSYGNYVRIKHMQNYKTAYAHLNAFAKGLKAGDKIEQGDVIGYIGTTGRSSGPHLHYEVLVDGKQVNPRNIKLPKNIQLSGKELEQFNRKMDEMSSQFASLVSGVKYAQITAEQLLIR